MNYSPSVLLIPHATENQADAAQYMIRHNRKQYNLCGEFCIAFCMQDEAHTNNIDEFLDYWQARSLKWYQSVFQNGLSRTTGIYDLQKMLAAYETQGLEQLAIPLNPYTYQDMLKTRQAIMGVSIDPYGYLVGSGIRHWVVLESIAPVTQRHAVCNIYNPFTNAIEPYSWRELMISTGSYKQVLWVDR